MAPGFPSRAVDVQWPLHHIGLNLVQTVSICISTVVGTAHVSGFDNEAGLALLFFLALFFFPPRVASPRLDRLAHLTPFGRYRGML